MTHSAADITLWQQFSQKNNLSSEQLLQFQHYYQKLITDNDLFNLTAITQLSAALSYHFEDSLILDQALNIESLTTIADVGTGAGFPALPLKIKYPHLKLVLVEVNHKKVQFLQEVAQELGLENIEISDLDWRTFLRKTDYPIDLFCARASLHPDELLRMFKPSSPYKKAQLVYWASEQWQALEKEALYIKGEYAYHVKHKKRRLIFFSNNF